jgi:hypothetical protein
MRTPSAGFGAISTAQNGGHTDVFLDSPAAGGVAQGYIRIGARLDWGGTIVFFGLGANSASNTIDANDTGRELQLALYDPDRAAQNCAWNASCATTPSTCSGGITYLGWDPVQGGDECGHGGTVLTYGQSGDALQLVIQPLQWNPDWDSQTCSNSTCGPSGVPVDVTYTFELRFVNTNVVEVATEVTSQETIDHRSTTQEFPTLYVSHGQNGPDLPLLYDASGNQPAISTPANDGFYVGNFTSSAPWVSWQDSNSDYGVALAMDQGVTAFQGWRGDGTSAPYFHNVRAQMSFGLPAGGTVRGISYLALGSYATVGALMPAILAKRPPFGVVDAPSSTSVAQGGTSVHVAGWVLDTAHLATVDVAVDGAPVGSLPVNVSRPDVCAVYPDYDGCPSVGFDGTVSVPALGDGCQHLLRVTATDADGNTSVLGERAISEN